MLTTIICTECTAPIDVMATSIQLPYICPACEATPESEEIYVTNPPFDTEVEEDCDCELCRHETAEETAEPEPFDNEPEPTEAIECDTASVENTTLLIADLEEQLTAAQTQVHALSNDLTNVLVTDTALMSAASQRIDQLEKSEQWLIETAANAAIEIGQLEAELDEAHTFEAMSHVALAKAVNKIDELTTKQTQHAKLEIEREVTNQRYIQSLSQQVADLEVTNHQTEASLQYFKASSEAKGRDRDWWQTEAKYQQRGKIQAQGELRRLQQKTESFWSRLYHLFVGY